MASLRALVVLCVLILSAGASAAPAEKGSHNTRCAGSWRDAYWTMTWSMSQAGGPLSGAEKVIEKAVCNAGCLGFCFSDADLPPLTPVQKDTRALCRKTGYSADCKKFVESMGSNEELGRMENLACLMAGGAACYSGPFGLHDVMTYLTAKLACLSGVPSACHYHRRSVTGHFKSQRERNCSQKGGKNCAATPKEKENEERFTAGPPLPAAPACADDAAAVEKKVTAYFESACKGGGTPKPLFPTEEWNLPYRCSEPRLQGAVCQSGWQLVFGCACESGAELPHYEVGCESGRKGIRCELSRKLPSPIVVKAAQLPAFLLNKPKADKTRIARKTEQRIIREQLANGYSESTDYVFKGFTKNACDAYKKKDPRSYYECVRSLAIAAADTGLCRIVPERSAINECLSLYASRHRNATACLEIADPPTPVRRWGFDDYTRARCLMNVAQEVATPEACEFLRKAIPGDDIPADNCYQQLAFKQKKAELCDKVEGTLLANQCYGGLAADTKNKALCEKLIHPTAEQKASCQQ